jgi:Flp pilus assembly protein TadG
MTFKIRSPMKARRPGQGLVEFAVIVPLFLLLVLGVVEFARAWNLHQVITDAAREGARTGAIFNPDFTADTVYARVDSALARARFDPTADNTTVNDPVTATRGDPITVTITYPYEMRIIRGLMRWTVGQSQFTVGTSVTMRKE